MSEVRYGKCSSCHATGIFHGTQESEGIGVICTLCGGSGKVQSTLLPLFEARIRREDITRVFSGITEESGVYSGQGISYEDFFAGSMPNKKGTTRV